MFQGGGKRQGLAAESAEVGGLNRADVAFCGDGVIGEGIALRVEKIHQNQRHVAHHSQQLTGLRSPRINPQGWTHPGANVWKLIGMDVVPRLTQSLHS